MFCCRSIYTNKCCNVKYYIITVFKHYCISTNILENCETRLFSKYRIRFDLHFKIVVCFLYPNYQLPAYTIFKLKNLYQFEAKEMIKAKRPFY